MIWKNDPSPNDGIPAIQTAEFNKIRGKSFDYYLNDVEKAELLKRQQYYVLRGGKLFSGLEVSANDTIVVSLNMVYDRKLTHRQKPFTEEAAKELFQSQIDDLQYLLNQVEIKFYVTWTKGGGEASKTVITSGAKDKALNVFLTRKDNDE